MPSGYRPEHENDREQARGGRGRVFEQLQANVTGRKLLGGDPRADDDRGQEGRAQQLCHQAPR